jgi:hypothetical protein
MVKKNKLCLEFDTSPTPDEFRQTTGSFWKLNGWQAWACFQVLLYGIVGFIGWNRTLIPDEIRPLLLAAKPLKEQLEFARLDLVQTPLSYLFQRLWLNIFGHTDGAAKASALLIGSLTLVLFTYLASQITPHWRLTTFLFSVPYLRIGSAVNLVRMYGLLLLLTVVAILIWEQWRKQPHTSRLMAWALVMTLMAYTHGSGLLLLPAFVLINWLYGPRRWTFTIAAAIPCLALLPWIAYVFPVYQSRGIEANVIAIRKNPTIVLGELPFFFLSGEDPGGGTPLPPLHAQALRPTLKIAAGVLHLMLLFLAGRKIYQLWSLPRRGEDMARWFWISVLLCGTPITLLYGFSLGLTPVLHARYVLVGLTGYWSLLVFLGYFNGRASKMILIGIFLPWVLASILLTLKQNMTPSPARQGTLLVAREMRDSDLILCDKHMPLGWQVYWEWTRRLGRSGHVEILPSRMATWLQSILPWKELDRLDLEGVDRIWFFYSGPRFVASVTEFLGARGFVLDKQYNGTFPFLLVFKKSV